MAKSLSFRNILMTQEDIVALDKWLDSETRQIPQRFKEIREIIHKAAEPFCGRCEKAFIENLSDYYCDNCYMYISEEGNRG